MKNTKQFFTVASILFLFAAVWFAPLWFTSIFQKTKYIDSIEELLLEDTLTTELKFTAFAENPSEWELFIKALIWQESKGVDTAKNGDNWGCLQIRPIYVREVNRIAGTSFNHEDVLVREKALLIFNIMNYYKNPQKDIDKAIKIHNPKAPMSYSKSIKEKMKILKSIM